MYTVHILKTQQNGRTLTHATTRKTLPDAIAAAKIRHRTSGLTVCIFRKPTEDNTDGFVQAVGLASNG